MAIKRQDLRYLRRSIYEIAVLRKLVGLQRCKIINPSQFWLAQMTRMSERQVRDALASLKKSGMISYAKHKQDYRGPNRPTNTYTLHPERIQELINEGKLAVNKALGAYYEQVSVPKHDRKRPAQCAGYTTGTICPPQLKSLARLRTPITSSDPR